MMRICLLCLAFLGTGFLSGCGAKGDPVPPPAQSR